MSRAVVPVHHIGHWFTGIQGSRGQGRIPQPWDANTHPGRDWSSQPVSRGIDEWSRGTQHSQPQVRRAWMRSGPSFVRPLMIIILRVGGVLQSHRRWRPTHYSYGKSTTYWPIPWTPPWPKKGERRHGLTNMRMTMIRLLLLCSSLLGSSVSSDFLREPLT